MEETFYWTNTTLETRSESFSNNTLSVLDIKDKMANNSGSPEGWLLITSEITIPLLLLIGLCGNALTIIVMRTPSYRHSSHGIYLTAMALSDIIFLLNFPFTKPFMHDLFGRDVRTLSTAGCKLFFFFFRGSRYVSATLIILISVERFVVVWFPLKTKVISTRRVAITLVICITVGIAGITAAWATTAGIKRNKCVPVFPSMENKLFAEVCSIIGMAVRTCAPAGTLLFLTPLTIYKLFGMRTLRRKMGNSTSSDDTYMVTLMLISTNVAFYLLVTPFCIAKTVLFLSGIDTVTSPERWARDLYEISKICELTNCVINFVLYVMLSSVFRKQVCLLFKRRHGRNGSRLSRSSRSVFTISTRNSSVR